MRQRNRRGLGRLGLCMGALTAIVLAGCQDSPTGTDRPPIPAFAAGQPNQIAQCAEWSCSIDDCQQDPGQYGACCTQAVDAEHPYQQPRPSCGGTLYD